MSRTFFSSTVSVLRLIALLPLLSGSLSAMAQLHHNFDPGYPLGTSFKVSYSELRQGFYNPPPENRLRSFWWWLNSMATRESITRDLEQMKTRGYGGASIVDAGSSSYQVARKTSAGPRFMSGEWMELYKHAIREADRFGIELSVNIQSGWNPGGPTITPELAQKKIVFTDTIIKGGRRITLKLRQPESKLIYRDIIVQAFKQRDNSLDRPGTKPVIKNWGLKSFNESFGFKGTYPLHKLREEDPALLAAQGVKISEVRNITGQLKGDQLTWDVPEGNWTIIRFGWTATGAKTSTNSDGWEGLSLDHLDPAAFRKFSNDVIEPLITAAKSAGRSLHYLQTDSWEMGNVGWTQNFINEFKKYRGYDMTPYLPVLAGRVVENVDASNRFLQDYRKTIGDCIVNNHYKLLSDLAHKHGLGIHPESGGPHSAPVDALKVLAISEFPQGEFWATANTHRIKDDERLAVKQSASVAHTNGKRYVAAEGPTSIGPQWERSPRDLKANIDRIFCSGVNRIVWHTFTSSPPEFGKPGNEYFAGTHLNPNVTWWNQAGDFISYLNRCSYLLAQGLFVADALYYYGDDVPNFVFLKEEVKDLAPGYDWDKCSKEVLLLHATIENNKLVLPDGMSYRLLVLPDEIAIDLEILKKLEDFVRSGLTIIAPKPLRTNSMSGYPQNDVTLKAITDKLWGKVDGKTITENRYGKGRVVYGKDVNAVLLEMNIKPDFIFQGSHPKAAIDHIHRSTDSAEIYFVANRYARKAFNDFEYRYLTTLPDRYEQVVCSFRVSGLVPELWDPVTGSISQIVNWREENGYTIVPLNFEPEGSKFIVFRKGRASKHITSISKDGRSFFPRNEINTDGPLLAFNEQGNANTVALLQQGEYAFTWSDGTVKKLMSATLPIVTPLPGSWTVQFDTSWGGPHTTVFDSLISWTSSTQTGIKYYSGTAKYLKRFKVNHDLKNHQVMLDLGNVLEMASVKVNGHTTPVRWSPPFTFDISGYVQRGENTLEIEVVNLWPNRLIGDSKLPVSERRTKTNIVKFEEAGAEKLLRESGLLGPVTIRYIPWQQMDL